MKFLLAFLFLLTANTRVLGLLGKCTLMPKGPTERTGNVEVSTDKDCRSGTIWWNKPIGRLSIRFPQYGDAFSICIKNLFGGDKLKPIDVSGNCFKFLPELSHTPVCFDAMQREADVMMIAPNQTHLFAAFEYYVGKPSGIHC